MEEAVEKMRQEQKFLLAKTEVVDGLSKTLADATLEGQQALQRVSAMQTELEVLRDRNLDLEQQTKKQSELLTKLQAAPQGAEAWVTQLQEMNRQLEKETQRRKALETALVEMENKPASKHATAATTSAAAAIAPGGDQDSDTVQARENRIRYEQERVAVIRGFLRQGLDAEKQAKIEAAQWNYQKVLELESDNAFALQRLGILAANSGNDLDTLRYLQQAFRQNPDDLDTLLALGFAQVRQSQADWAVSTLGRAVSLYPDSIDAARAYGIALLTMGWTQAAETQLKKTITMKPEDAETAFNLAVLLATETPPRIPEAAKWYAKAVKNGAQPDPGLDAVLGTKNDEK